MHLVHYKIKTKEEVNQMRKRLEEKHKNISLFYSIQLEKRKNIINSQKKDRDEKVVSNIYKRIMNKNKEFERRVRLLDLFEKNEERVEQKILLKEKRTKNLNTIIYLNQMKCPIII